VPPTKKGDDGWYERIDYVDDPDRRERLCWKKSPTGRRHAGGSLRELAGNVLARTEVPCGTAVRGYNSRFPNLGP
jgi:hypothetical protein